MKIRVLLLLLLPLLTLTALSSPIKSDEAAMSIAFTDDSPPTAADYIQNGLIAMWDAIENVDWGVHDSSTRAWYDLVAGEASSLDSTMYFGDDYLSLSRDRGMVLQPVSGIICSVVSANSAYTEEVCYKSLPPINTNDKYVLTGGVRSSYWMGFNRGYFMLWFKDAPNWDRAQFKTYIGSDISWMHTFSRAYEEETWDAYINGLLLSGQKMGASTTGASRPYRLNYEYSQGVGFSGKCCNIRFYSRRLSDAEIRYNALIDRLRFNLP